MYFLSMLKVEQLSEHGGEEAMLFTASVSDGTFHHLGSTATKGFLDSRDNLKSQFLGHCMKGRCRRMAKAIIFSSPEPKAHR